MFIHVCLLNGFSKPLLYNLPDHIKLAHPLGSVVRVPLRDRSLCAVIVNVLADQNIQPAFTVKDVEKVELFPQDFLYFSFLKTVAQYHQTGVLNLYARMRQFFVPKKNKKERECIQKLSNPASPKTITLTHEQQNVVSFVGSKLGKDIFTPTLLQIGRAHV